MITNRRVFEDHYLPNQLPHRSQAVDELARAFEPALAGRAARDVLIHGPSGVGKTVLARFTLEQLEQRADVKSAIVECLGLSAAGIYRSVLRDLGADPAQNTPMAELQQEIQARADNPIIVVLDEADDIPDSDGLEWLVSVPGVSVVIICHDVDDWLARAGGQVRGRFASHGLRLTRYRVGELADILEARARSGLQPEAVRQGKLEAIADHVAGVARDGIQSLFAAAEVATENGHREIQDADIQEGYPRAERRIRAENLKSLPYHHHVLYELIRRADVIGGRDLHDYYETVAEDVYYGHDRLPISGRERRTKLQKLRDYDLISYDGGDNKHGDYRVLDPDLESPLDIDIPEPPSRLVSGR